MDAIEKRARQLLDAELRKLGLHEDAYHVGCGADLDRNDQAAINAISAAITPPDGYVLVPVEPTTEMLVDGFESEPDEFFSTREEWLAYEAMSGCQQGHHRSRLCWGAMLAARPEVPS